MKKILFICTGNTCRSPMAMFLFKEKFKEYKNLQVDSAGLDVKNGDAIAPNAVLTLSKFNINDVGYNSKQLTKQLFFDADLVVTMTERQKNALPKSDKVVSYLDLTGKDVLDPFMQPQKEYQRCAEQIVSAFDKIITLI